MLLSPALADDDGAAAKKEAASMADEACKQSGGRPSVIGGALFGCGACPSDKEPYSYAINALGRDFTAHACKPAEKKTNDRFAKARDECHSQNRVWNEARKKCEGGEDNKGGKDNKEDGKGQKGKFLGIFNGKDNKDGKDDKGDKNNKKSGAKQPSTEDSPAPDENDRPPTDESTPAENDPTPNEDEFLRKTEELIQAFRERVAKLKASE